MSDLKLLKFEAEWCGPCKQQSELLRDFDTVPVENIDIDENLDRANEYAVRSVPTLVLLQNGVPVKQWTGLTQLDEIESSIEAVK